jgi:glycosyltransferase involved in cell wall biosynthesis
MTKLKIVMLTTFYPPYSYGGDAIGIERLVSALARDGHEVTVVHDIDAYNSLSDDSPRQTAPTEKVTVIGLESRIGLVANLLTHQLGRPVVHRRQLEEILKPGAFDILWFHNISLVGGPALLSYGDGLKIYEAHEHWLVCPTHVLWRYNRELCDSRKCIRCAISYGRPPQIWRYQKLLPRQLDHVDAFIAKSDFSRRKHAEMGFPREMTTVPYFLPDREQSHNQSVESCHDRPFFLFVGRLEKIKGLDEVIPLFADYPEADLLVLGTGEYEPELKSRARKIPNVKFLGRLAPDELWDKYSSAIALIVPSVCYETFGIILIEAFREGTPVIARRIGPFEEIVNDCGGGVLYSDNRELLDAMKLLQANPAHRQSLGKAARAGYETHWSERAVMGKYYETVRRAAQIKGMSHIEKALEGEN